MYFSIYKLVLYSCARKYSKISSCRIQIMQSRLNIASRRFLHQTALIPSNVVYSHNRFGTSECSQSSCVLWPSSFNFCNLSIALHCLHGYKGIYVAYSEFLVDILVHFFGCPQTQKNGKNHVLCIGFPINEA